MAPALKEYKLSIGYLETNIYFNSTKVPVPTKQLTLLGTLEKVNVNQLPSLASTKVYLWVRKLEKKSTDKDDLCEKDDACTSPALAIIDSESDMDSPVKYAPGKSSGQNPNQVEKTEKDPNILGHMLARYLLDEDMVAICLAGRQRYAMLTAYTNASDSSRVPELEICLMNRSGNMPEYFPALKSLQAYPINAPGFRAPPFFPEEKPQVSYDYTKNWMCWLLNGDQVQREIVTMKKNLRKVSSGGDDVKQLYSHLNRLRKHAVSLGMNEVIDSIILAIRQTISGAPISSEIYKHGNHIANCLQKTKSGGLEIVVKEP